MQQESGARRSKGRRGVYREVYQHYADLIDSGQLSPGDRLPTSDAIARERGISHATAAKALQLLRDELYARTDYKGTYVFRSRTGRLLEQLSNVLNSLEDQDQLLQLESGEHGACIMGRDGGVCWNSLTQRWEPADI
jgi:DNA-binding GntR family transcriptional regulator